MARIPTRAGAYDPQRDCPTEFLNHSALLFIMVKDFKATYPATSARLIEGPRFIARSPTAHRPFRARTLPALAATF